MRTRLVPVLLVGLVAFGAGWLAVLPGVQYWDTGELQAVAPLMGTGHPTGFPTYVLLGWLASVLLQPFGEPAFRMNIFSVLCVAVAAGVTVDLVRQLTGWIVLGIAAGIAMALTPIAWAIATHAETHSLHLALIAIVLWLLVAWEGRVRPGVVADDRGHHEDRADRGDRFLVAAALVFALAIGNHSLTLLLAVPVGLYVIAVDPGIWRRGRLVVACAGVLALTLVLIYLELPLRAGPFRAPLVYGAPNTWEGFKYIVLAEQFQGSFTNPIADLPQKFGELVGRTVGQFGILAPLVPIGFLATVLRRPRYALLTGTAAGITCFFAASYINADIGRYYLVPALMAWTWLAILAGTAVDVLSGGAGEPAYVPLTGRAGDDDDPGLVRMRSALLGAIIAVAILVPTVAAIPTRFATVDATDDHSAAAWTDHALEVMQPNAMIVSWWSYSTPLWYAQLVQGRRPDIAIVDDRTRLDQDLGSLTGVIDANLGKRPVYVIRLDPAEIVELAQRYDLDYIDGVDASSLTRVVGLRSTTASP
jgi:hypothetical protein